MAASATAPAPAGRWLRPVRPEPRRMWIAWRPRRWSGPPAPWIDLAGPTLGEPGAEPETEERQGTGEPIAPAPDVRAPLESRRPGSIAPAGLIYLPPVPAHREPDRRRLAERLTAAGGLVLVQAICGAEAAADGATVEAAEVVWDPLEALLADRLEALDGLPEGATVVWPLVAGRTDGRELVERGLVRLAAAGARRLVAMTPDLSAADRRRLAAGADEAAFRALFHRSPRSERWLAQAAHRAGLEPFFERPLTDPPAPGDGNRGLAGHLARLAELWLGCGRSEAVAHRLFAASRRVERDPHDLERLAAEGELAVVDWLDGRSRRALEEWVATGGSALEAELAREYLEGPVDAETRPTDRAGR